VKLANVSAALSATGLAIETDQTSHPFLSFIDSVFRGIGQVMLQNNSYAGLIFLVGVLLNSVLFGCAVLLGTIASTVTAVLLGADHLRVREGSFGFNGALVAIALFYFLEPNALTGAYVVLAAACTTVIMAALLNFLSVWRVPALTAPFVLTTLVYILACARFGRLHSTAVLPTAGLPKAATLEGVVTASTVVEGLFNGVAQVFFQNSVVTGVFVVVGLLICSRVACSVALLGSSTGMLVAWGMGAAEPAIRSGAFGFNSTLTALVFIGGFFMVSSASTVYGIFAAATAAVVFAATSAALEPLGMPALTSPFVLVSWLFLLASPLFLKVRSVLPAPARSG
jgi:urea transporter